SWWQVANQSGALAVPPPPDVSTTKHELYVHGAGGAGLPGQVPAPPAQPSNAQGGAQSLAAIRYQIPDGAEVKKLTLKITGTAPPSAPGIIACLITDPAFRAEDNGPASDIPKYDCGTLAAGKPNAANSAIEFADIGKLVKGGDLQLMLVPGQLDRVVFAMPDATALQVGAGFTQPPPVAVPGQLPAFSSSVPAPAAANSSGGSGSAVGSSFVPPIGEPPLPAPLPARAPAGGVARRVLQAVRPAVSASRIPLSPQLTRLVVGAATLLAIAAFAAMVLLGPRMNALGADAATAGGEVRGIGRFARARTGDAPKLW
ncbi:MAG: hypothetical protein ACR2MY_15235, partial [Candidatus Dormibacteria bacterium]